jgi:two-component system sensor histidine kinase KdpD
MRGVANADVASLGTLWDYVEVLAVIAVVTVIGWFTHVDYHAFGYIYLLAVIGLSLRVRRGPVLTAAIASAAAWDFVFVPPRLSFTMAHMDDCLLLGSYFVVALIGTQLTALRSADGRARLLAESERMHQTLLDSVSHELRTPIAALRSAVEQSHTEDRSKHERMMEEIRIAVQRLDNLVTNLLNLTRVESGVLKPQLDWCDGHDLVVAARRAVESRLEGRAIEIEFSTEFPIFIADAALMEQAIAHLMLNAAFHTPPTARIRVTAGVSENSNEVFITVADDGPGISDELRDKIFDKFSRGSAARGGGLGLGLSIVRGFMLAQGGDVSVESPPEGGARFTLFLPRTICKIEADA